jgi:putative hydroxymethylpyrimidine transport system substrate-binding protein
VRAIRVIVAVAVAVALSAGLGGCGEGGETESVKLPPLEPRELDITLDGYPSAQNVGILVAEQRGYFDDVGLDIWVRTPQSRVRPLPYVAEGEVALAVSHRPQVELAQEKDAPVVAFGSLISQPTAAMIWLEKSKIGGIADLKGKTVAVTGLPFEMDFLQSILARADLTLDDVKVERSDYYLVPALVQGRADAILGSSNLEGAELEARKLDPVVTPVTDLGIPAYEELVLITRSDRLAKEPRAIRIFMKAVERGTAAAIEDPGAAAAAIEESIGAKPDSSRKVTEAQLEATLPLLSADAYDESLPQP